MAHLTMFILIGLAFAWADQMLATAAQIALNELGSDYANRLALAFETASDEFTRPAQAAAWSYYVERPPFNLPSFRHWHFHAIPFSPDQTPTKERYDEDDLVEGINGTRSLLGNLKSGHITRLWPWAFAMKVCMGMICDSFAALHTTVMFSRDFPNGDDSGRKYMIRDTAHRKISLFDFWETGCGKFENNLTFSAADWAKIDKLAAELAKEFPREREYDAWTTIRESHDFDVAHTYAVATDEVPSDEYLNQCWTESRKRVARAGWAIADTLKKANVVVAVRTKATEKLPMRTSEAFSWMVMMILAPIAVFLVWKKHIGAND